MSLRKITESYLELTIDPFISWSAWLLVSGFLLSLVLGFAPDMQMNSEAIKISRRRQFICYCVTLIADAVCRINDYFPCLVLKSSPETFTMKCIILICFRRFLWSQYDIVRIKEDIKNMTLMSNRQVKVNFLCRLILFNPFTCPFKCRPSRWFTTIIIVTTIKKKNSTLAGTLRVEWN